jgi:tetratricopeptide (TPR) repeat protein
MNDRYSTPYPHSHTHRLPFRAAIAVALVAQLSAHAAGQSSPSRRAAAAGLTAAPALGRAYDAIFDARFEHLPALLGDACGSGGPRAAAAGEPDARAPQEVCQVLDLVALWWQIQLDPLDPSHDEDFRAKAEDVIAATEAWTEREPWRAEAFFYLGGAYGARVQFRVLRGESLAAARDGKRIKDALDESLRLDPSLQDAYFGIGLYHYYADVAPAAAKFLRRLFFLPGGDRATGLRELQRARDNGLLTRNESDYQLHLLYLWYEKRPEAALELLRSLQARHPGNSHFAQLAADVEDVYLGDLTASLRSWDAVLTAAREQRVANPRAAEARARLAAARLLDRLYETDRAIEHARVVIRSTPHPSQPYGIEAEARVLLAQALDRLGLRTEAMAEYRLALDAAPDPDPGKIGARAREGIRRTPPAAAARAYRLSLEGWRALERGNVAEAARAVGESLTLAPGDHVTRYRHARVLLAQKNEAGALAALETIVGAGATEPPSFYAVTCAEAARLYERRGDSARAIEMHRLVVDAYGGDRRVKEASQRALIRLTASASMTHSP